MQRRIVSFDADEAGDWRARLDCGHYRHFRHDPPLVSRAWVLAEAGRAAKVGAPVECLKCDSTIVEGFILAGGASRRMERNKAALRLGDKTFVELAADALAGIAPGRVSVVGGDRNAAAGLPFVPDKIFGAEKVSIYGLYTALMACETEWAAIVACDMPFVGSELWQYLLSQITEDIDAVVPVQPDGYPQPFCALYKCRTCVPVIEEMIENGNLRLREFLSRLKVGKTEFNEISNLPRSEHFFTNINTLPDLKDALKTFS
jgi:molybdopterin-guanine dinucleotide biosynthesis protein A